MRLSPHNVPFVNSPEGKEFLNRLCDVPDLLKESSTDLSQIAPGYYIKDGFLFTYAITSPEYHNIATKTLGYISNVHIKPDQMPCIYSNTTKDELLAMSLHEITKNEVTPRRFVVDFDWVPKRYSEYASLLNDNRHLLVNAMSFAIRNALLDWCLMLTNNNIMVPDISYNMAINFETMGFHITFPNIIVSRKNKFRDMSLPTDILKYFQKACDDVFGPDVYDVDKEVHKQSRLRLPFAYPLKNKEGVDAKYNYYALISSALFFEGTFRYFSNGYDPVWDYLCMTMENYKNEPEYTGMDLILPTAVVPAAPIDKSNTTKRRKLLAPMLINQIQHWKYCRLVNPDAFDIAFGLNKPMEVGTHDRGWIMEYHDLMKDMMDASFFEQITVAFPHLNKLFGLYKEYILYFEYVPINDDFGIKMVPINTFIKYAPCLNAVCEGFDYDMWNIWMMFRDCGSRTFHGCTMDPMQPKLEFRTPQGLVIHNLFKGIVADDENFQPTPLGIYYAAVFLEHLKTYICNNKLDLFKCFVEHYVVKFNYPGETFQYMLGAFGGKNTGKTTHFELITNAWGAHGFKPQSMLSEISKQFNIHQTTALVVFIDEIVFGGNIDKEKAYITRTDFQVEVKNGPVEMARDYSLKLCTSNNTEHYTKLSTSQDGCRRLIASEIPWLDHPLPDEVTRMFDFVRAEPRLLWWLFKHSGICVASLEKTYKEISKMASHNFPPSVNTNINNANNVHADDIDLWIKQCIDEKRWVHPYMDVIQNISKDKFLKATQFHMGRLHTFRFALDGEDSRCKPNDSYQKLMEAANFPPLNETQPPYVQFLFKRDLFQSFKQCYPDSTKNENQFFVQLRKRFGLNGPTRQFRVSLTAINRTISRSKLMNGEELSKDVNNKITTSYVNENQNLVKMLPFIEMPSWEIIKSKMVAAQLIDPTEESVPAQWSEPEILGFFDNMKRGFLKNNCIYGTKMCQNVIDEFI